MGFEVDEIMKNLDLSIITFTYAGARSKNWVLILSTRNTLKK